MLVRAIDTVAGSLSWYKSRNQCLGHRLLGFQSNMSSKVPDRYLMCHGARNRDAELLFIANVRPLMHDELAQKRPHHSQSVSTLRSTKTPVPDDARESLVGKTLPAMLV